MNSTALIHVCICMYCWNFLETTCIIIMYCKKILHSKYCKIMTTAKNNHAPKCPHLTHPRPVACRRAEFGVTEPVFREWGDWLRENWASSLWDRPTEIGFMAEGVEVERSLDTRLCGEGGRGEEVFSNVQYHYSWHYYKTFEQHYETLNYKHFKPKLMV